MRINRRRGLGLLAGAVAAPFMPYVARAQTADKVVIGVQYGLPPLNFIVAEKLDLFRKHAEALGVEAQFELTRLSGPTVLTEGLISGNIHIAALGVLPLLIAYEKTRDNYRIGGLSAYWKGTYTIFANDPAIRSIADIRPSDRIALPGPTSSQAVVLRRAAEQIFGPGNADRFDQQIVTLPHPDAVAALSTGNTIQVYFALSPFTEVLARAPNVHVIGTSDDYNPQDLTNGVVAAPERFVTENPRIVEVYIAALGEANDFIRDNVEETTRIYFEAEPSAVSDEEKLEIIRNNRNEYTLVPNGVIDTARFANSQNQLALVPDSWQDVFFAPINQGSGS